MRGLMGDNEHRVDDDVKEVCGSRKIAGVERDGTTGSVTSNRRGVRTPNNNASVAAGRRQGALLELPVVTALPNLLKLIRTGSRFRLTVVHLWLSVWIDFQRVSGKAEGISKIHRMTIRESI